MADGPEGIPADVEDRLAEGMESVRRGLEEAVGRLADQGIGMLAETRRAAEAATSVEEALSGVAAEVAALREHTARQQASVQRWQDGYDWQVLRRLCTRLLRITDDIERMADGGEIPEELALVRDHILIALEDEGVEELAFEPGTPYAGLEKVAKVVGRPDPEDPDDAGKVAGTVSPGFVRRDGDGRLRVVRPARVSVYADNAGRE
jgi:molecular chaperone GrpE (heat shock protein)